MKRRLFLSALIVYILALAVALLFATPPIPTCACTPPPGGLPDYTVADRTNAAEVVLEGTVIALTDADYYPIMKATVKVHQYFKGGSGPVIVTITGFGPSSLCLSWVNVGERWVFYATGNPSTGLEAHYLSQFDAVDPADPQTIAEVIAAVGQDPVLPFGYYVYLPVIIKPRSNQVIISDYTHWESYGHLHIVGRVRNDTEYNVTSVHFAANLFDNTGRLIDIEDWGYVPLDIFAPGDETCFFADFSNTEGWAYYEFEEVHYWKTTNEPLRNMTIYGDYGEVVYPGGYRILGFVRNDNDFVVHSVATVATLFNDSGDIIGCNGYFVSTSPLDPVQSTSFENWPYWNGEEVASYRLQVDGWYTH